MITEKDIISKADNTQKDIFFSPAGRNQRNYIQEEGEYLTKFYALDNKEFISVIGNRDITELYQVPDLTSDLRNSLNSSLSAIECLQKRIEALEALLEANNIELQSARDRINELTQQELQEQLNVDNLTAFSSSFNTISQAMNSLYNYIKTDLKADVLNKSIVDDYNDEIINAYQTYVSKYESTVGSKSVEFLNQDTLEKNISKLVTHAKEIGRTGKDVSINTRVVKLIRDGKPIKNFNKLSKSEKERLYKTSFLIYFMHANNQACTSLYGDILGKLINIKTDTNTQDNASYAGAAAAMEIFAFTYEKLRTLLNVPTPVLPEINYVESTVPCDNISKGPSGIKIFSGGGDEEDSPDSGFYVIDKLQ